MLKKTTSKKCKKWAELLIIKRYKIYIVERGRVILQNEKEMSNALSAKRLAPPTWQTVPTNPQWRPSVNGALTMGPCCQEGGFLQRNFCQRIHVEPGWEPSRAPWMTCVYREPLAATWRKFFFSLLRLEHTRLSILSAFFKRARRLCESRQNSSLMGRLRRNTSAILRAPPSLWRVYNLITRDRSFRSHWRWFWSLSESTSSTP